MTTFKITPELKKRIVKEVAHAEAIVAKEMAISFDLRNHDMVAKYNAYIQNMSDAIKRGTI